MKYLGAVFGLLLASTPAADIIKTKDGRELFKDDWCFCVMPTLRPDHPSSLANTAVAAAALPGDKLVLAGTEPRARADLGSGWMVRAVDQKGVVIWSRSLSVREAFYEVARSLASDTKGRVVAAGFTEYARGGPIPAYWLVVAYDSDGKMIWHDALESSAVIRAESVALDADGSAVVAGWEGRATGPGTHWVVRRYAPDGTLQWSRTHEPGFGTHAARAVAINAKGEAIVAGQISEGGGRAVWTVRALDRKGHLAWSRSYPTEHSWMEEPYSIAVAPDGRIAVVGKIFGGPTRVDWAVKLLTSNGDVIWTRTHNGPLSVDDKAYAVRFDECGRVIVAGYEDGDTQEKPPWDAGRWMVRAYDEKGEMVAQLYDELLQTKAGGAYALARIANATVVVGFEKGEKLGETVWSVRKPAALACPIATSASAGR